MTHSTDELWLGTWGVLRAHGAPQPHLPLLPTRNHSLIAASSSTERAPSRRSSNTRRYRVEAVAHNIVYNERLNLSDPFGLQFRVTAMQAPGRRQPWVAVPPSLSTPLVLRARLGEWVEVHLSNRLPNRKITLPRFDARTPLHDEDRPVSNRVSLTVVRAS
jgi:hypothetical protein